MKKIMNKEEINRAITRISHEILERGDMYEDIIFLGVVNRGYEIAMRLSHKISEIEGVNIPIYPLNTRYFRDDLVELDEDIILELPNVDVNNKTIIIVDDVIYTGRTTRAALDAIVKLGRPSKVQLVALIDRGHREFPIRPDFVGKNIPTSRDENVGVRIQEIDGIDEVYID